MRTKEQNTIYHREYRKKNREKMREYKSRYNAKFDREKNRVRDQTRRMFKQGYITEKKKCEKCKCELTQFNRNFHHEDYRKPLEVTFLCKSCHYARHKFDGLSLQDFLKMKFTPQK